MSEDVKDFFGAKIEVGDTVVWGVGKGAYGMRSGTVTEVKPEGHFQGNIRVKGKEFLPGGWMGGEGVAIVRPEWQTKEFREWLDDRAMMEDAMERHG